MDVRSYRSHTEIKAEVLISLIRVRRRMTNKKGQTILIKETKAMECKVETKMGS